MKKTLFIVLILFSLAACSGRRNKLKNNENTKASSIKVTDMQEDARKKTSVVILEEEEDDFSNMAVYSGESIAEVCVIEEVRDIGDPVLTELYGDLAILQDKADECVRIPRDLEELKKITREIGRVKGRIEYRSLEVYHAIN